MEAKITNYKFKNIEFLRFFLSCVIVIYHLKYAKCFEFLKKSFLRGSGNLAVDFSLLFQVFS